VAVLLADYHPKKQKVPTESGSVIPSGLQDHRSGGSIGCPWGERRKIFWR